MTYKPGGGLIKPKGCKKLFVNCDGVISCIAPFADEITREKCIYGKGDCEFRELHKGGEQE